MPTPPQIAAAARVAEALATAGHGKKRAIVAAACAELGVSAQTLYTWMRPHRGTPRAVRADSQTRVLSQRRALAAQVAAGDDPAARDALLALDAQLTGLASLPEHEARLLAATMTESARGKGGAKQLMSLGHAVDTLRAQGLIQAGRVDPETGELKLLSLSAISRGLKRFGLHQDQLRQPTPHQPIRTLHPNARWEIDASVCVVYYLPGGGAVVEELDPAKHYKNKPEHIQAISQQRVIRYVMSDHCSGVLLWHYYPHSESGAHTVAFLARCMARQANPAIPVHGAPFRLVVDPGATAAGTVERFCGLAGIDLEPTGRRNPRAKGSVEKGNDIIEHAFEAGLRFQKQRVTDFDSLNALADVFQAHWGATAIHSRHGLTRFAAWAKIQPHELRITEGEAVLRTLATEHPATPKVNGELTVAYRGQDWDVSDVPGANVGDRIAVLWSPLLGADGQGHAVAVLTDPATGREVYRPLPLVARDDWGFRSDAPVDGERYARPKDTAADRARKDLAMLASGTTTLRDDELARRRKGFRPLAGLDDGRGIDPYRTADTAEPVAWLPRRGTDHRVRVPIVETPVLDHVAAALRLAPLVRAAGGAWGPERYQWLAERYPAGVPEDALEALVRDCAPAVEILPDAPRVGLTVVR